MAIVTKSLEINKELYANAEMWVKLYTVVLVRVIDIGKLSQGILQYVLPISDPALLRPEILECMGTKAIFGIDIYNEVIKHLNNLLEGKFTMDYRVIHLMAEHKMLMLKKLEYVKKNFKCSHEFYELVEKYRDICDEFKMIRLVYLKNMLIDNNFGTIYGQLKNKEELKKIIGRITTIKDHEKDVMYEIYNELKGITDPIIH